MIHGLENNALESQMNSKIGQRHDVFFSPIGRAVRKSLAAQWRELQRDTREESFPQSCSAAGINRIHMGWQWCIYCIVISNIIDQLYSEILMRIVCQTAGNFDHSLF